MEKRLIDARLWSPTDGQVNEQSCSDAWRVLSRLGAPYRCAGKSVNGIYEYLVLDPDSGDVVASARNQSSAKAMCEAALAACKALRA